MECEEPNSRVEKGGTGGTEIDGSLDPNLYHKALNCGVFPTYHPGFYCPEGSEAPIPCPDDTIGSAPGARQRENCLPCPPGRWCKAGQNLFLDSPSQNTCARHPLPPSLLSDLMYTQPGTTNLPAFVCHWIPTHIIGCAG